MIRNIGIGEQVRLWDGLQSYWKFDSTGGTTAYNSIIGFNGTLTKCSFNSGGKNNYCVATTGGTSLVNFGVTPYNFERTQAFTYSFWFKNKANWSSNMLFGNTLNSGTNVGYQIYVDNTSFYVDYIGNYGTGKSIRKVYSATGFYDDTTNWHNLVACYNGTSKATGCTFYLDGVLQTATSISYDDLSVTMVSTNALAIGNRVGLTIGVDAYYDEFCIWNRALNATEAKMLYSAGNGKFYGTNTSIWNQLQSYWSFATTGSTISDLVGGRNLTASNVTWSSSGKRGNCPVMNGSTSSLLTVNTDTYTNAQVVTGSIAMWIKVPINASQDMLFFSAEGWIALGAANTTGYLIGQSDGGVFDTFGTTNVCTDNWVHIVYTWNATTGIAYINGGSGISKTQANSPTPDSSAGRTSGIGCNWNGSYYFNGSIDEVAFWSNRELTHAEAQQLYNNGNGIFY